MFVIYILGSVHLLAFQKFQEFQPSASAKVLKQNCFGQGSKTKLLWPRFQNKIPRAAAKVPKQNCFGQGSKTKFQELRPSTAKKEILSSPTYAYNAHKKGLFFVCLFFKMKYFHHTHSSSYMCDTSAKHKKGTIKYRSSFFPDQSHHMYFEDENLVH